MGYEVLGLALDNGLNRVAKSLTKEFKQEYVLASDTKGIRLSICGED